MKNSLRNSAVLISIASIGLVSFTLLKDKNYSFVSLTPGAMVEVRGVDRNGDACYECKDARGKDSAIFSGMYTVDNFIARQDKRGYRTLIEFIERSKDRRYYLREMKPYPQHKDGQRNIYVEHVDVSVDSNHYWVNYYNSMNDFHVSKVNVSAPQRIKIMQKDVDASDDLNRILVDCGYLDTNAYRKVSLNDYNWVELNCEITGIAWHHINNRACVDLTVKWKIKENLTEKTIFTKTITSRSNWGLYTNGTDKDTLEDDALKQGLFDVLSDPKIDECLVNGKTAFNSTFNSWTPIAIKHPVQYSATIQEATKAVVTVKLHMSHGSGCLISNDGYIITNSHVVSDTNIFSVIFANGDKHIGRLIRSNPVYDLALIKVDTVPAKAKPLQLGTDDNWSIGTDVFAIGTPSAEELSQTLTKGIVSATRVVNDVKYIQSDASISPGNSGGALLTKEGILIGIVNAKMVGRAVQGLGFAIPSEYVSQALKLNIQ